MAQFGGAGALFVDTAQFKGVAPLEGLNLGRTAKFWASDEMGPHLLRQSYVTRNESPLGGALLSDTGPGPSIYSPCLLYTSPSPRDGLLSRMPSSA